MKKILIVDDDYEIREILATYLSENNFDTETAENLKTAGLKLASFKPDLILLDMNLPDGAGNDFLREMNKKNISIPVIMVTGITEKDIALESIKLGATDYITKPIDLDYLSTSVISKLMTIL
ncbi:MAG: response regulator [Candidatus Marinimicrobia bacterium]|nr:response regulator [Candidatus Neomarinimicrobiota bacterium]